MTTGAEQELHQVEISIEDAKKMIDLGESLSRLQNNKDFKKVISDAYLTKHALRMVQNKASFGMQDERQQKYIDNEIIAIGSFEQFLRYVAAEAEQARMSLIADQETREDILREVN